MAEANNSAAGARLTQKQTGGELIGCLVLMQMTTPGGSTAVISNDISVILAAF